MPLIVIDTSALVAIFKAESNHEALAQTLSAAHRVVLPATCLVEAALLSFIGKGFFAWVEERLADERFEIAEITLSMAHLAAKAARAYGKGSGHRAQLNFGDCLSYAVAKDRDLPLLYCGKDFDHTDIAPALLQD